MWNTKFQAQGVVRTPKQMSKGGKGEERKMKRGGYYNSCETAGKKKECKKGRRQVGKNGRRKDGKEKGRKEIDGEKRRETGGEK